MFCFFLLAGCAQCIHHYLLGVGAILIFYTDVGEIWHGGVASCQILPHSLAVCFVVLFVHVQIWGGYRSLLWFLDVCLPCTGNSIYC